MTRDKFEVEVKALWPDCTVWVDEGIEPPYVMVGVESDMHDLVIHVDGPEPQALAAALAAVKAVGGEV